MVVVDYASMKHLFSRDKCLASSNFIIDVTDGDEGPPNTFTVIYVTNDKDSGRGSPDTDTICTPPPHHLPTFNPSDMSVTN